MKQSAWYDIIKHIHTYDPLWHCRRFEMEQLASFLRGRGYESKAFIKQVAKHIPPTTGETETTKETFQSHMRHLRKSAGNCLLLAPRLMNNENLLNSRIMLLVSKVMWSEQTLWGVGKITPEQDCEFAVRYADGLGDEMIKRMWTNAVGDARELHRIGFQTMPGEPIIDVSQPTGLGGPDSEEGVPLDKVPGRLMSFLFHFAEARLWSYAWLQFAYPEAFAGLLSPKCAREAWEDARELWVAATDAEASAHTLPTAWNCDKKCIGSHGHWFSLCSGGSPMWISSRAMAFCPFCLCCFAGSGTPSASRNPTRSADNWKEKVKTGRNWSLMCFTHVCSERIHPCSNVVYLTFAIPRPQHTSRQNMGSYRTRG